MARPSPPAAGAEAGAGSSLRAAPRRRRIHALVRRIPPGQVATYGQIAALEGNCGAREVGYAMAALAPGSDVPWQRVVNARGGVSARREGDGAQEQRARLLREGVLFDRRGRIDLDACGWPGPDWAWLERHGFQPAPRPGPARRRRS